MDELPEYEDVPPEELSLPEIDTPRGTIYELAAFIARAIDEEERVSALAKDYLDKFYDEVGNDNEAASAIIGYIQFRHKWELEVLAGQDEVEKILYEDYSLFDDAIWEKVINSESFSDMHHEVHEISVSYIKDAIDEVLDEAEDD